MAKEEWGVKRICKAMDCDARFYDLMKDPIICPKCGAEFIVEYQEAPPDDEFEQSDGDVRSSKTPAANLDDDDILDDDSEGVDIDDDVLDESDEETVPLDDIANVATDDDS